eukprot:gnl/TRDRNA2_/TRDRNA2_37889_c0_seq1.p1 gnl/TRDRNA2_/TRDRNA2_37889_c0~~gnl/TRDRNA2_/TRDRNA2_37889_c0_seq1.p1  ORF type:complete len:652 (+),score=90.68 gnl/TRDRNA2_/TRDRNA2_37889_c0_seq1:43-1956(+)
MSDAAGFEDKEQFFWHCPQEVNLEQYAVPIGERVTKRLLYPDLRPVIWPSPPKTGTIEEGMARGAANMALPHFLTHLILFQDRGQSRPDRMFESLLTRTIPHAAVVIGGKNFGRAITYPIQLAARGNHIVVMNHTGLWADVLSTAVRRRRSKMGPQDKQDTTKADDIDEDQVIKKQEGEDVRVSSLLDRAHQQLKTSRNLHNFIIFDANKDTGEKVVDQLTKALSIASGEDTLETGFAQTERDRLLYAWELYLLFNHNAQRQWRRARLLQYAISLLSFLTTASAVLSTVSNLSSEDPSAHLSQGVAFAATVQTGISIACSMLPIVSTFLISTSSKFNFTRRFAALFVSAQRVRSEIYRYRARVGEYGRHTQNATIQRLMDSIQKDGKPNREGQMKEPMTGRELFAETVTSLQNELMSSELKLASLKRPPRSSFDRLAQELFPAKLTQNDGQAGHRPLLGRALEGHDHSDFMLLTAQMREEDLQFDDGMSCIGAELYILFRMGPKIKELNEKAPWLERLYFTYQMFMLFGTMASGVMAIMGLRAWVPLVVALVATVESVAQFEEVSARLIGVNTALSNLKNLKIWWQSLSQMERRMGANKTYLVETSEDALALEYAVFAQGLLKKRRPEEDGGEKDKV